MTPAERERIYWNGAAMDEEVDRKYIADVDTDECLTKAIRPHLQYGPLLEIGSGVGRLTIPLALDTLESVTGIDSSPGMVNIAKKRAKGIKNLVHLVSDGRTIPLPDESQSSIYCMLVFQHLPLEAVASYLREASRVLQPNGTFIFQFIEGNEDEPFSKHHSMDDIENELAFTDLFITSYQKGLLHPQWSWVVVTKK